MHLLRHVGRAQDVQAGDGSLERRKHHVRILGVLLHAQRERIECQQNRQMRPALANSCPTPAERARLPPLPALDQAVLPRRALRVLAPNTSSRPELDTDASAANTDSPNQGIPDT